MAGIKQIPVYTIVAAEIPSVDITTYYQDPQLGGILNVFINESFQIVNSNPVLEGYLVAVGSEYFPSEVDLEIDVNGELIVFGEEAYKYDIDSDGNLTYTD